MALVWSVNVPAKCLINLNPEFCISPSSSSQFSVGSRKPLSLISKRCRSRSRSRSLQFSVVNKSDHNTSQGDDNQDYGVGVNVALSVLKFYKSEISPLLPKSCRYVPTCSDYSIIAYKKYGVTKGSILTAWRICRCNPLGGSGFDPPRWFDEPSPPQE